jgi:butyryl-CoA dehydrogenase
MILNQEQELIRDSLRAFAQERLAPFAAEWDRNHTFPREALKELAELGRSAWSCPRNGGAGMDYMSLVLALEEIAAGDGATSTIVSVQNSLPCGITPSFGSEDQKQRLAGPARQGRGSGLLLPDRAARGLRRLGHPHQRHAATGISGCSTASSSSSRPANTPMSPSCWRSPTRAPARRASPAFSFPRATPGYIVGAPRRQDGATCQRHRADHVRELPRPARRAHRRARRRLSSIALSNLEAGRIGIAAQCLGMARAALEAAVKPMHVKRESFGKPLFEHQAVSFRLADMATQLDAARQMVWRAAQPEGRRPAPA